MTSSLLADKKWIVAKEKFHFKWMTKKMSKSKIFEAISSCNLPQAIGAYSPVVKIKDEYFFSGQIGLNPKTGELHDDFSGQLEQILYNIDQLLEAANLQRSNIVKTTVFLTDMKQFHLVNKSYESFFTKPFPARSCVEVKALPKGAVIEIEVIAIENN